METILITRLFLLAGVLFAAALPGTLFAGTVTFSFDGIVYFRLGSHPEQCADAGYLQLRLISSPHVDQSFR